MRNLFRIHAFVLVVTGVVAAQADFEDVSKAMGIDGVYDPEGVDHGVCWVDMDGDGWPDLFLSTYSADRGAGLLRNDSGRSFLPFPGPVVGAMVFPGTFADFDNDGDMDYFTAMAGGHLCVNDGAGRYTERPIVDPHPYHSEAAAWGDLDGDGFVDLYRTGWEAGPRGPYFPDARFANQEGKAFTRLWWQEAESGRRAGRGVTMADFDEDGDLDIFVCNYRLAPNFLWVNDGSGDFTDQAAQRGVAGDEAPCSDWYSAGHSVGAAWGDLDNDGHLDLVAGNLAHADACQDRTQFLRNTGGGGWRFEDRSATVALAYRESFCSPALGDYDNDGDLDVFLTTSYPGDRAVLLRNDGSWRFTDVTETEGLSGIGGRTNFQAAWADFDRDGDLDLFTGRRLFRNTGRPDAHWLKVRLLGDGVRVDRSAVGTQVRVRFGDQCLTREVATSTGWANQNDAVLHFGLGSHEGPVDVEVRWLDGTIRRLRADVDHEITISGP